ncbi:MAG: hypothetical protein ACO3DK_03520 [Bacteroidia bacterium]
MRTNERQSSDEYQKSSELSFTEHLQYGLETQIFSLYNGIYLEAYPIALYNVQNRFYAGIGPHFALVTAAGMSPRAQLQFGGEVFARLSIQNLYLQGEYKIIRAQNTGTLEKETITSPIFGIGYVYGYNMASWVMLGIATNSEISSLMPLGRIVYRIGFCF